MKESDYSWGISRLLLRMWGVLEVGMCASLLPLHLASTGVSSQVRQTPVPVLRRGESHLCHCCKRCRCLELIAV